MQCYCPSNPQLPRQQKVHATIKTTIVSPGLTHIGPGAPKFDIVQKAPVYIPPTQPQPKMKKVIYEPTDPTGKQMEGPAAATPGMRAGSLEACTCSCTTYGTIGFYNVTRTPIQKWLSEANRAGRHSGINPVCFLAMASVESNGVTNLVTTDLSSNRKYYGIVQIGAATLAAYNCMVNGRYSTYDLIGQGIYRNTEAGGVSLSFEILGEYLKSINGITNAFSLSATSWNGPICGASGVFQPFGNCATYYRPTAASCYGKACVRLASAYSDWWINPYTGNASSFYWGDLAAVEKETLPLYNYACLGI